MSASGNPTKVQAFAIKVDRGDSGPLWKWTASVSKEALEREILPYQKLGSIETREIFCVGGMWRIRERDFEKPVEFIE